MLLSHLMHASIGIDAGFLEYRLGGVQANAEYVGHTPPTVDVTVEGASVKCHVKQIKPTETTTIVLQVRADGPLRQQQATIRIED